MNKAWKYVLYNSMMYDWIPMSYHDMMTNGFIEGSHNYFNDIRYITCLCLIPTHWAVIRSYITEPWAHPPIDVLLSCRFLSLTQGTGSPADQFQTLLLHTKKKVYCSWICMYNLDCIVMYVYLYLWPKVSLCWNVSYVWSLSLVKIKFTSWMLRKQMIMNAWLWLVVVELEARVCVGIVWGLDDNDCMNKVVCGRAYSSRTWLYCMNSRW